MSIARFGIGWILCIGLVMAAVGCPAATPGNEPQTETTADASQEAQPQEQTTEPAPAEPAPDASPSEDPPDAAPVDTSQPEPSQEVPPEVAPEPSPEPQADLPPKKASWSDTTELSDPRQETAVVALGGEIFILGGFDGNKTIVDIVEAYNPTTQQWRKVAPLLKPMHHINAAVYDGKIYALGSLKPGFGADGACFVYDPKADKWSSLNDMPRNMARGASVLGVIGDKIYVIGGFRGFRSVTDLSEYDPKTDTWKALAPIPTDLDHLAGGAIDGKIVIAGGRHGGINSHIASTYVYDPTTDKWTQKSDMPTSRGGTAGAVYKGRLYIFGGEGNKADSSGVFHQVESYELATDTWRKHPDMKTPRHGTNAATIGGKIYVPGGATTQAFGAVKTFEIYNPDH